MIIGSAISFPHLCCSIHLLQNDDCVLPFSYRQTEHISVAFSFLHFVHLNCISSFLAEILINFFPLFIVDDLDEMTLMVNSVDLP